MILMLSRFDGEPNRSRLTAAADRTQRERQANVSIDKITYPKPSGRYWCVMVGECLYIKTKFSVAAVPKGEKFAILGDQG